MSYAPYTNLQATPDFANFQFSSPALSEPTVRQVCFIGQQGGHIYHVEFRNKPAGKKDEATWPESKDFLCVVLTLLQIIEIYSERYPRRILRFNGNTTSKALVFGAILTRYHHLLQPLFQIEAEMPTRRDADGINPGRGLPGSSERSNATRIFLIKRKPVPYFSVHTVESTWNGTSRIFRSDFSIEVDKSIRIGLTLPTL
ncbi:MAG TPA: hypothetical protein VMH27_10320 [Puia sp.]|nr:hypothetical protein [Puia sp.]